MGRSRDGIKIFLRVRPKRDREGPVTNYNVEHTFEESKISFHLDRRNLDRDYINSSQEEFTFRFDRVFDQATEQEEVFEVVAKDSVQSVLEGYNSTIFAYGQTGSGKTHTITGGTERYDDRGIIPRSIKMIFDEIKKRAETHHTMVYLSYMQIYNNKAMDLLNRGKEAVRIEDLPPVSIHETEDEIVLRGLEAHPATTTTEALHLLFLGDTNRLYSETSMNENSSRSHCILSLMLESRAHGSAVVTRSKLNLVDLAGSERVHKTGVTGTLLNEAKYINVSLFHLEHVIVALSEGQSHIPFRDSIMTMALKDSLGSNCRTSMIATGHPAERHVAETISTCRFAQRVASIKQKAVINQETDPAVVIRQLKREVASLKDQLAALTQGKDTDPNRALGVDEQSRCREAVQRFVADTDATAELLGLGGDLARTRFCFRLLKEMTSSAGKRPSSSPVPNSAGGTPITGGGGSAPASASFSDAERQALLDQVRRLQTSVQQKENELSLLFAMMDGQAPGAAPTPPASASSHGGRDPHYGAGGEAEPRAASSGNSHSIMSRIRSVAAANSAAPAAELSNGGDPSPKPPTPPSLAAGVVDKYDLDKLSDPELLKDRQAAFEAFRKSYRKYEQVEKNQAELKERIGKAKAVAGTINGLIDEMKALKNHIQQLRAENALMGKADEDAASPEEVAAKRRLDEELRPRYRTATEELAGEKERIEYIKQLMVKTQAQLIKDFEAWFKTRQAQVAAAMRHSHAAPPARAESGSAFTQQMQLAQRLDLQRHEARMDTELTPAQLQFGTPTGGQSFSAGSASAAAASLRTTGGGAGGMVSTGNAEADADLARMYKARDELRMRLQQQQQASQARST